MFEWKSGDEDEWVDEATAVPDHTSTRFTGKVRGVLVGFVLCLLLLGALGLAYRGIDTRVTAVTSTLEQEIAAANRLLLQTATSDDTELFAALLNPSPTWTDSQIRLQARNTFFDRPPLALWLDTRTDLFATDWLSATQFTIAPDLNTAELTMTMPYVTLNAANELQPLLLQRTAVYRRQGKNWLLAEPDEAFWGEYVLEQRPYLNLTTPVRDQEIASRLADDLSGWMVRICQDLNCPTEFAIQLRLSSEPQSLLDLYTPVQLSTVYQERQQTRRISLPAPTLVGLPTDEAGYQTLLRGYATHLALALRHTYGAATPDFAQLLAKWGLFSPWPNGYSPIQAAQAPPIPLPAQDILLLCQGSRIPNLFRYDSANGVWSDVSLTAEGVVNYYMTPFPEGDGVVLSIGPAVRDGLFRIVWLRNGREYLLFTTTDWPYIHSVAALESDRYLLYYSTFTPTPTRADPRGTFHAAIIDPAHCMAESCAIEPFAESIQPSPDGRATLITRLDKNQGLVYALGNASGEEIVVLENGDTPFWLDGRTLAYLQTISGNDPNQPPQSTLMTAVLSDNGQQAQVQTRLTAGDIPAALPGFSAPNLLISGISGYPTEQPEQLFLSVADMVSNNSNGDFVLHYDWQNDVLLPLKAPDGSPIRSFGWQLAVNGRYLMLSDFSDPLTPRLRLFDNITQEWQVYEGAPTRFYFGGAEIWSEDGNWFVLPEADAVRLVAPNQNYQKILFHGLDYCETALWVDRFSVVESGP